jgi:hypothetical protein
MWMLGSFTQAEAEVAYRRERIIADFAPRTRSRSNRSHRGVRAAGRPGRPAAAQPAHQAATC